MARLNVFIPDDLYPLITKWRHRTNFSEICAVALRRELEAREFYRNAAQLFSVLRPPTQLEKSLVSAHGLLEATVSEGSDDSVDLREKLGEAAASYLSNTLCDGALLGFGGGRQMWCVVRSLTPRNLNVTVTALGIGQNDPRVLNAHPNTLTTLLWLLFSPRAEARIVGQDVDEVWTTNLPAASYPKYFVIGSCGPFDEACHLAPLLGQEPTSYLLSKNVVGDFIYNFFDGQGQPVTAPQLGRKSILSFDFLRQLSKRSDARVVLVAGGSEKLKIMRFALHAGIVNVLITDRTSAEQLLN